MITRESLDIAMPRFITEIKKVNGNPYPGKTLYDIVTCVQFHLENLGFCYKLLNEDGFREIKWSLDNVMKLHTSEGVGVSVRKAQILCFRRGKFMEYRPFGEIHTRCIA